MTIYNAVRLKGKLFIKIKVLCHCHVFIGGANGEGTCPLHHHHPLPPKISTCVLIGMIQKIYLLSIKPSHVSDMFLMLLT